MPKLSLKNLLHLPEEFGSNGSELEYSAGEGLTLHQGWRVSEFVLLQVATGDTHGLGGLARGHNHPHARVSAAAHCAASSVHHEADQEPAEATQKRTISRRDHSKGVKGEINRVGMAQGSWP